jgi:hypothetical protein
VPVPMSVAALRTKAVPSRPIDARAWQGTQYQA